MFFHNYQKHSPQTLPQHPLEATLTWTKPEPENVIEIIDMGIYEIPDPPKIEIGDPPLHIL